MGKHGASGGRRRCACASGQRLSCDECSNRAKKTRRTCSERASITSKQKALLGEGGLNLQQCSLSTMSNARLSSNDLSCFLVSCQNAFSGHLSHCGEYCGEV